MDEKKMPGYGPPPPGIAVCPTPHDNDGYIPDEGVVMPPTAPPLEIPTQERMPLVDLGSLSDEDVRDACLQFASENCCYGKKFIRETTLPQIYNGCTFHYQLETFGEKRETAERHEPYRGEYIDGPENGIPPAAWDIPVTIPAMFVPSIGKVEVPHTARVRECFRCVGNCRVRCESCYGRGGNSCWNCHGSGRRGTHPCSSCGGAGRQRCWNCSGSGQVKCGTCDGIGRLRHFIILIITWSNHVENYITDTSKLPKTMILEATGKEIFREENVRVYPINHATDETVNTASLAMVEKHAHAFPSEFIRQQRHILRAVPLVRVQYAWKQKQGEFYVYGFQKKVYFEDYPQKCICCTCC